MGTEFHAAAEDDTFGPNVGAGNDDASCLRWVLLLLPVAAWSSNPNRFRRVKRQLDSLS